MMRTRRGIILDHSTLRELLQLPEDHQIDFIESDSNPVSVTVVVSTDKPNARWSIREDVFGEESIGNCQARLIPFRMWIERLTGRKAA